MTTIAEPEHYPLSPSAAHRWLVCPGEVAAREAAPQETSSYALEGTTAHWLAARCLKKDDKGKRREPRDFVGQICPETQTVVPPDMVDPVNVYLRECRKLTSASSFHGVEDKFLLPSFSPRLGGTADFWSLQGIMLNGLDFKYGQGVIVDPEDNPQLRLYMLGALERLKSVSEGVAKPKSVSMAICQPRTAHSEDDATKSWVITVKELIEWSEEILKPAIKRVEEYPGERHAGSHCQFCPAKATCPEVYRLALATAQVDFAEAHVVMPEVATLKMDRAEQILKAKDVLIDWLKAVENHVFETLKNGGHSNAFKLVKRRSDREWVPTAVPILERMLGDQAYTVPKLITPAQAEKILGEVGLDLNSNLWHKPDNGYSLAPARDQRQEVRVTSAAQDYIDDSGLID